MLSKSKQKTWKSKRMLLSSMIKFLKVYWVDLKKKINYHVLKREFYNNMKFE